MLGRSVLVELARADTQLLQWVHDFLWGGRGFSAGFRRGSKGGEAASEGVLFRERFSKNGSQFGRPRRGTPYCMLPSFVHPLVPVFEPHVQKWVIFVRRRVAF